MESRPVAGGVPVEEVSLDKLPKGCEVIFQRIWFKKIYLGL